MSNIRFLDQVSVSSFDVSGGSGSIGPSGSTGPAGPSGSQGPEGSLGVWKYSTDTSTDAPSSGYFHLDASWSTSTSYLYLADNSFSPSVNWSSVLDSVTVGSIVKLSSQDDSTIYKILQINSVTPLETGYEKYFVTQLGSNGTPSADDEFGVSFPYAASSDLAVFQNGTLINSSVQSLDYSGSHFEVTSLGSNNLAIEVNPFPYTGSASITGSFEVIGFSTLTGSLFIEGTIGEDALAVYSGSEKKVSVNSEGVLALDEFAYTPTAVAGGLIYSASSFWVGIE
jgi:hypothetical protein